MSKYSRILVTGGAGFIGSHIVDRLLKEDIEVSIVDNFFTGNLHNISEALNNKHCHLFKGDIRDQVVVKQAINGVDAVIHEAAAISIAQSIEDPVACSDINIMGTLNLIRTAINSGVKRFIFASSAAVYGEAIVSEKTETLSTNPTSPYGVTKLSVEKYLRAFFETNGLEAISLRYFNVYGPRQRSDINGQYGGVITIFLNRLLNNLPPIIFGDGEQTRDFVYIQDVVEANMCALKCNRAQGDVFNVGTGNQTSVNQVSTELKILLNKQNIPNIYKEPRIGDVQHCYAKIKKAASEINWAPRYSFQEGLKEAFGAML